MHGALDESSSLLGSQNLDETVINIKPENYIPDVTSFLTNTNHHAFIAASVSNQIAIIC